MTQTLAATLVAAVVAVALLAAMSVRADRVFRAERRLPMQWGLDGRATWSAPRKVALAFTPVLAAACLAAIVALTAFKAPRPGQEDLVVPVTILTAMIFVGVHALHLWLMWRTVERRG